ncbi:unnamed protein product [Choristocarpus tenellus]
MLPSCLTDQQCTPSPYNLPLLHRGDGYLLLPYPLWISFLQVEELCHLLQEGMVEDPSGHKIIVFFTTARLTQFYAELFNLLGFSVLEIHSRKSQGHRTKVSNTFRNGRGLVMFTSDVSARGMDYPDVSGVIQVGLPTDRAQYIHRLGRTARAGKNGHGVLLLCDYERAFLKEVKDLPLEVREGANPEVLLEIVPRVRHALGSMKKLSVVCAYQVPCINLIGWLFSLLVLPL